MARTFTRRQFIGGTIAFGTTWAAGARRPADSLAVRLLSPDGAPLAATRSRTMLARDLANDTLPLDLTTKDGLCQVSFPGQPIQLACRLDVPGFGEVYCYADNDGRGYDRPAEIDFVMEAARTRLRRVTEAASHAAGVVEGDAVFARHIAAARRPIIGPAEAYQALAHGLHAGERLTLRSAQRRISRLPAPRRDFLFGGMVGHSHGAEFEKRFTEAFNFGTVNWYIWGQEEPVAQRIDYGRMDQSTQWCEERGLRAKGYGYVYLNRGAMPVWLRAWPYEKVRAEYEQVVEQTTRRFANRWRVVEVINEAHDVSNLPHYSHRELVELTVSACRAARVGAPHLERLINNCCLWGEYARRPGTDGVRRWTPFRYLRDCKAAGAEFERIGMQLYYPQNDLFEIERMLDRFSAFGCPLHISEIACNSAPGLDPACMLSKDLIPGWHGPWTETMQADWVEAIYTLCYSKPQFEAVGWWDLADYGGHFWPHGGLLHADNTPKEGYLRLIQLKKSWGLT